MENKEFQKIMDKVFNGELCPAEYEKQYEEKIEDRVFNILVLKDELEKSFEKNQEIVASFLERSNYISLGEVLLLEKYENTGLVEVLREDNLLIINFVKLKRIYIYEYYDEVNNHTFYKECNILDIYDLIYDEIHISVQYKEKYFINGIEYSIEELDNIDDADIDYEKVISLYSDKKRENLIGEIREEDENIEGHGYYRLYLLAK